MTRRTKVLVWDDEIPVTEDMLPELSNGSSSHSTQVPPISPHASIASMPLPTQPRRTRSQSISGFPPPIRRMSTDMTGISRPVSFSAKFQRVHPATTGVTVLEHMERLDAVEAGLKRLGVEDNVIDDDDEEVDVGESSSSSRPRIQIPSSAPPTQTTFSSPPISREPSGEGGNLLSPSAGTERLPAVPEGEDGEGYDALAMSFAEEDLVAMSKSTSQIEAPHSTLHTRFGSYQNQPREERPSLEWMQGDSVDSPKTRTMIVEVGISHPCTQWLRSVQCAMLTFDTLQRLETVDAKPLCSCW